MPLSQTWKRNATAAASLLAKPGPAQFVSLVGMNAGGAQYIHVFDLAAAAAENDTTAVFRFQVPDGGTTPQSFSITFSAGVQFTNGIYVCNSSTLDKKTIGSANCYFTVVFR